MTGGFHSPRASIAARRRRAASSRARSRCSNSVSTGIHRSSSRRRRLLRLLTAGLPIVVPLVLISFGWLSFLGPFRRAQAHSLAPPLCWFLFFFSVRFFFFPGPQPPPPRPPPVPPVPRPCAPGRPPRGWGA